MLRFLAQLFDTNLGDKRIEADCLCDEYRTCPQVIPGTGVPEVIAADS